MDLALRDEDISFLTNKENDTTSIILFDHHFSWYEKYIKDYKPKISDRKKFKIFFDEKNTKSACGLSFDYYKSKCKTTKCFDEKEIERVFNENLKSINDYIEDSDIGRFQIKGIHEFKSALSKDYSLHFTDFSFNYKNRIKKFIKINPSHMVQYGKQILIDLLKQTKEILKENWKPSISGAGTKTTVKATIGTDGSLINHKIIESSGNDTNDRSVIAALERSVKFPQIKTADPNNYAVDFQFIFVNDMFKKSVIY